jgi:hypothetical protein
MVMLEMSKLRKSRQVILRDTRGNYSLGIKLPTANYKPRSKQESNRLRVRKWKENNPEEYRKHLQYVKQCCVLEKEI